jgi:hypothetical protein
MKEAVHRKSFQYLRETARTVEELLNNHVKKIEGDEVWQYYQKELIEIIYITNTIKRFTVQIEFLQTSSA